MSISHVGQPSKGRWKQVYSKPLIPVCLESTRVCLVGSKWKRRLYQMAVFAVTYMVYTSYHLSRVALGVVKPVLRPDCTVGGNSTFENVCRQHNDSCPAGWKPFDEADGATRLGGTDSAFLFSYAIGLFISGQIAERTPPRYFLLAGMTGSVVSSLMLGFGFFFNIHSFAYFIIVQIIGGLFQSTGWPALIIFLVNWFGKTSRGTIMGIWNSNTAVGNLLGYLIPAIWATPTLWGWSFLSSAFIMITIMFATFLLLVERPEDVSLSRTVQDNTATSAPHVSSNSKENILTEEDGQSDEAEMTLFEDQPATPDEEPIITTDSPEVKEEKEEAIKIWQAIFIPSLLEYSLCFFFTKLVVYTLLYWLPFYVNNNPVGGQCFTTFQSALIASLFDVGSVVGGIISGGLSDIIHSRAIACFVLFILAVPTLVMYIFLGSFSLATTAVLVTLTGVTVSGPYSCITTAVAADLGTHKKLKRNQKAKATVGSIIDGAGSFGAALGPLLTGVIYDHSDWAAVFYFLTSSCIVAAAMIIRLVVKDSVKGYKYFSQKCKNNGRQALSQEDNQSFEENVELVSHSDSFHSEENMNGSLLTGKASNRNELQDQVETSM